MAPIASRLKELLKKRPPPTRLRRLPVARRGFRWDYPPRGGEGTPRLPHRPPKPAALTDLEASYQRLRRTRRALLERPELHRNHQHQEQTVELIESTADYILSHDTQPPPLTLATPFDRWAIAASVPAIESDIASHQWGQQWRANDIRSALELDRRAW